MKKRKKVSRGQFKAPRLRIILENYAGIEHQEWTGMPRAFSIDWPSDISTLLGERSSHIVATPSTIEFSASLEHIGVLYRTFKVDHEKGTALSLGK